MQVKLDISSWLRMRREFLPLMAPVWKKWAARYRAAMMRRFVKLSRGGGEWPDLKESTKMARFRRGSNRRAESAAVRAHMTGSKLTADEFDADVSRRARRSNAKQAMLIRMGGGGKYTILRDTGVLLGAMTEGAPGSHTEFLTNGVRVGFGGGAGHEGGKATIADIASFHQEGAGHLPVRKILDDPDGELIGLMAADAERGMKRAAREVGAD